MNTNRYGPYSLSIIVLLITTTPAFAEVANLQTNNESYYFGDLIKFQGNVKEGSTGLVTVVIRDLNDEFVMLAQATINHDNSFEKTVKITDKFSQHGIYNATGFILNMTKGVTTSFGVSLNGVPIILDEDKNKEGKIIENPIAEDVEVEPSSNKEQIIEESIIQNKAKEISKIAEFVDQSKDPQYYIDRYYNEKSYKSWFDRNYPELTIEEAVGYTEDKQEIKSTVQEIIDKEIVPEAQATSIAEPVQQKKDNPETTQIILAVAGLAILFGAVYGIKRQVDDNSRQISINRETLRKKFIQPILGSNPKEILQTRLAKGEITLAEYEKIREKLTGS